MLLIRRLAETNRTPFDLTERESELVSGFNVEYSATLFTLLFLAEYTNILLMIIISRKHNHWNYKQSTNTKK